MRVTPDSELGFRALTVRQPFASQIARGQKRVEYRSWSTEYVGDFLITASARPDTGYSRCGDPRGVAICVVQLVRVDWPAHEDAQWVLANPRPVRPVATRGRLQLWPVPDQLAHELGLVVVER